MALADTGDNNDFVAAKVRWDLAGSIMLGGEGDTYDIRDVRALHDEAQRYEERISALGKCIEYNLLTE
jgi:hypothetical protein